MAQKRPATEFPQLLVPGDKVIRHGDKESLNFGTVKASEDENSLYVQWDSEELSHEHLQHDTNVGGHLLHHKHHVIGLYDRLLPLGARIMKDGKEGYVFGKRQLLTVSLMDQGHFCPKEPVLLSRIREHVLQPVVRWKVGDTILYRGWVGVVKGGVVDVTYKFSSSLKLRLVEFKPLDLDGVYYIGKKFEKLKPSSLKYGEWTSGFRAYNMIMFRNKGGHISDLRVRSLDVLWVERIRAVTPLSASSTNFLDNLKEPPTTLEGWEELSQIFTLDIDQKYEEGSIHLIRWGEESHEDYEDWKQHFLGEIFKGEENLKKEDESKEEEPFVKRCKSKQTLPFCSRNTVTVRVLFVETELNVIFNDGSVELFLSRNVSKVLPQSIIPAELPFPERVYKLGDVVRDVTDFHHCSNKYGFVIRMDPQKRTVLVNWVTVTGASFHPNVQTEQKEMSQYGITPFQKYEAMVKELRSKESSLKEIYVGNGKEERKFHTAVGPLVVVGMGIFEGVIIGINIPLAKVSVKCAEGPVKDFYLHELEFLNKIVQIDDAERITEIRKLTTPQEFFPRFIYCVENSCSAILSRKLENEAISTKTRFFISTTIPWDNSFFTLFQARERFDQAHSLKSTSSSYFKVWKEFVDIEINTFLKAIANDSELDYYLEQNGTDVEKTGLLTVVVFGPKGTLYEDVPFFLDILFPHGFWKWAEEKDNSFAHSLKPKVVVRLPRLENGATIHPLIRRREYSTSSISYPDDCLEQRGVLLRIVQYFSRYMLCCEPFLQLIQKEQRPISLGFRGKEIYYQQNEIENNNNIKEDFDENSLASHFVWNFSERDYQNSRNFNESALMAVTDHLHSLLCHPPTNWKRLVEWKLSSGLPKFINRMKNILKNTDFETSEKDLYKLNRLLNSPGYLIYPLTPSFILGMEEKLKRLEHFLDKSEAIF